MMTDQSLLKADNVSFTYETFPVLDQASFKIGRSEVVALLGPSGCGQSTLLNLIAGFLAPMSGGMRQRVGVARVIAAEPRIMLMDEPFAAVDVQTREALQEKLLRIHEATRCAIVFATHSIEEAVFLSDRIFVMAKQGGHFEGEFDVDLPSPRWNPLNRLAPEFLRLRDHIYRTMKQVHAPSSFTAERVREPA